jgi:hypothetical protein
MAGCAQDNADGELLPPVVPVVHHEVAKAIALSAQGEQIAGTRRVMLWGYFRDPSLQRWFISYVGVPGRQTIYSLMPINSEGEAGWATVGVDVARSDLREGVVNVESNLDTDRSDVYFDAGWQEWVSDPMIHEDRRMIQGATVPIDWYFFRVDETGWWYILLAPRYGADPVVLRFASLDGQYDWQQVDMGGISLSIALSGDQLVASFGVLDTTSAPTIDANGKLSPAPAWPFTEGVPPMTTTQGHASINDHDGDDYYALDLDRQGAGAQYIPLRAVYASTVLYTSTGNPNVYGQSCTTRGSSGLPACFGNQVILDAGDGVYCRYAHLDDAVLVSVGQHLEEGDWIGYAGNSGASSSQHLHFACYANVTETGRNRLAKGWSIDTINNGNSPTRYAANFDWRSTSP